MNVCNVTAITLYIRATMPFVTVDPDRDTSFCSEKVFDPGPPITRRWLYSTIQTSLSSNAIVGMRRTVLWDRLQRVKPARHTTEPNGTLWKEASHRLARAEYHGAVPKHVR